MGVGQFNLDRVQEPVHAENDRVGEPGGGLPLVRDDVGEGVTVERGLTTPNVFAAATDMALVAAAQQVVVLADHTKIGRDTMCQTVPTDRIDVLITDRAADPATLEALRAVDRPLRLSAGGAALDPRGPVFVPAVRPHDLGDASFRADHGLRFAYLAGAMANGIGSVEVVEAIGGGCR